MVKSVWRLLLAVVLVFVGCAIGFAQGGTQLSGTVTDSAGQSHSNRLQMIFLQQSPD